MLLLSLSGVTKKVVDGAKEAVSSSINTAKEAYENTVNSAKNLVGIDTDTEEPDSDGETPRDRDDQIGIDADSEPDDIVDVDLEDSPNYLNSRREYVFEFSQPRLTPSEYLDQERFMNLTSWAIANADTDQYDEMQFAVTYRVIRDGEVFDTSRRRTQRLQIDLELQLKDELIGVIQGLAQIAQRDYDNIFLDSHAVIVTETN